MSEIELQPKDLVKFAVHRTDAFVTSKLGAGAIVAISVTIGAWLAWERSGIGGVDFIALMSALLTALILIALNFAWHLWHAPLYAIHNFYLKKEKILGDLAAELNTVASTLQKDEQEYIVTRINMLDALRREIITVNSFIRIQRLVALRSSSEEIRASVLGYKTQIDQFGPEFKMELMRSMTNVILDFNRKFSSLIGSGGVSASFQNFAEADSQLHQCEQRIAAEVEQAQRAFMEAATSIY